MGNSNTGMKKRLNQIIAHPLVSGSVVVFIGSNAANVFHFLFNFSMVRNLTPANYGDITGLISLIMLATMPAGAIIPMIINFAARFYAKQEMQHIRGLFFRLAKILFIIGVGLLSVFIVFASQISDFFNIHNVILIYIAGIIVFIGYISVINTGLLQAKLAFTFISITNLIGAVLKYTCAIVFVFLGFGSLGAMVAYTISYIVPYLLSFLELKFVFDKKIVHNHISIRKLLSYGGPAAIALYVLTSFITTDILLVKHFFNPEQAGIYAVIALAGRVIFFLTAPIASVMFPLIVHRHEKKESYNDIFFLANFFILIPSIALTTIYFFFPEIVVLLFNQQKNASQIIPYLGLFGIYMTIYSLLSVATSFFLSIGKTKIYIPLFIGGVLQVVLIWAFHRNFLEVILISISIVSLLLLVFLLYYWKLHGKKD